MTLFFSRHNASNLMSHCTNFNEFLSMHIATNNTTITHTQIPGPANSGIKGGKYSIPDEKLCEFYRLYYDYVFGNPRKNCYLTECQRKTGGPLLIDLDFKYAADIKDRQHNSDHISDIIEMYLDELSKYFVFNCKRNFNIYVMHKQNVNCVENENPAKCYTKDGIHIVFGIKMPNCLQVLLREHILTIISEKLDELPVINTWDKIVDDGIAKGCTNWQLYGCKKPENEPYELTNLYTCSIFNGKITFIEKLIEDEFNLKRDFFKMTARYHGYEDFEMTEWAADECKKSAELEASIKSVAKHSHGHSAMKIEGHIYFEHTESGVCINLNEITDHAKLEDAMNTILDSLSERNDFRKREIHDYTQILPEKYYADGGSHKHNRNVAFALKNMDERLFFSWIMLRAKCPMFEFSSIPELYVIWCAYFNTNDKTVTNMLQFASIIYYARTDAPEEYAKIRERTLDGKVEQAIFSQTEFDYALILLYIFDGLYVCCDIEKRIWYVFTNHHWELDKGQRLRLAISQDLYYVFNEKSTKLNLKLKDLLVDPTSKECIDTQRKLGRVLESQAICRKTSYKNNIMREAAELFYDDNFITNRDENPYLTCCKNGVIDTKNKIFRPGKPTDYITLTTKIMYEAINPDDLTQAETRDEIITFMAQLFPNPELRRYMWEHLASSLIGFNINQTFNIYLGSGKNGKSKLTDLMTRVLGNYKGIVPISLITEKRVSIGGTSSEIIQLKGIRYAVMQEPRKGMKMNEGIMKELTGGDPLQGRGLYRETETFNPQFDLVVCTNVLFEIMDNSDGTWRRIRIIKFESKFLGADEPVPNGAVHVFPLDKKIHEKFDRWAPVMLGMLAEIAFRTNGYVEDCPMVIEESLKYREKQDTISKFINAVIEVNKNGKAARREISEQFRQWCDLNVDKFSVPKSSELHDEIERRFGTFNEKGIMDGISVIYQTNPNDEDELNTPLPTTAAPTTIVV